MFVQKMIYNSIQRKIINANSGPKINYRLLYEKLWRFSYVWRLMSEDNDRPPSINRRKSKIIYVYGFA